MLTRRDLLLTSAAAGLALTAPGIGFAAGAEDAALDRLLGAFADEMLVSSPESAAGLGLDNGVHAALKSRLDDRSLASLARDTAECQGRLARLKRIDRRGLSIAPAVSYDSVAYALELGIGGGAFGYGENTLQAAMGEAARPYVVDQQSGAFNSIPEFLDTQHLIETKSDADAYLARLEAFGTALDQESERLRHDAGRGVIMPDFILDTALSEIVAFRATPADQSRLVSSVASRAKAKGIAGDYAAQATRIVGDKVAAALDRQIAVLQSFKPRATHDAGMSRLPDGEAYYAWLLKVGTSTPMTADEIHRMGLEQNQAIQARMDGLLRAQGMSQGSVGARMTALSKDPRFLYPNTDEGRAAVLAYLNGRIAAVRPLLPKVSRMDLKAEVVVKRVPPDIELGAGLGYMNSGSLDGSRPSIYYINLHDTANWPRWTLPTLTFHETIPGHVWQGAFLTEKHTLPLIRTMLGFNAYVEGWALYAEQLGDELGLYADDPFGQLGYLQFQQFRACRLVVDTGLHSKHWSREQAVQWFVDNTGRTRAAMVSEVDRYCSTPGQACGYKIGHTEINRLRDRAKAQLGARYDVRDFNDAVVVSGGVPLTVLASVIDGYIKDKRG